MDEIIYEIHVFMFQSDFALEVFAAPTHKVLVSLF